MNRSSRITLTLALAAAFPAFGGSGKNSTSTPDKQPAPSQVTGRWRFSAGAAWRSFGDVDWSSGPSFSSSFALPSLVGQELAPDPRTAGPLSNYANREYLDGFVRTGSPTTATGETWNWGYSNASQVSGDAISFHTDAGPSSTIVRGATPLTTSWNDDDPGGFAPFFAADYMFDLRPGLAAGLQLSFMFTPFDAGNRSSNFSGFQERRDYSNTLTDLFRLDGSRAPEAPYQGSFNGPGLLLRNIPDQRIFSPAQIGSEHVDLFNSVQENLDVDLCTFSVGVQTEFRKGRFAARGGAGLAINVANVEAGRRETLNFTRAGAAANSLQEWKNRNRETDVLPGVYLSVEAAYALNDRWSISAFGRHDWNEDIAGSVGPSRFNVDLDGWTAGLTFNWLW